MDESTFGNYKAAKVLVEEIERVKDSKRKHASAQVSTTWNKYIIGMNAICGMRRALLTTQLHMLLVWRNEFRKIVKSSKIPRKLKRPLDNIIVAKYRNCFEDLNYYGR